MELVAEHEGYAMSHRVEASTSFAPGQRVIYTRMERPVNTEWPATYVRALETVKGVMHVISLDAAPRPRTVGRESIRAA